MNKLNATMENMIKFQQKQQMMDYHQQLRQMIMKDNYPKRQWDRELYARYNEIVRVGDAVINRHTKTIARVIRKDEVNAGAYLGGITPNMITVYVLQYQTIPSIDGASVIWQVVGVCVSHQPWRNQCYRRN